MKHIKYILLSAVVLGFTACNDVEDVLEANGESVETTTLPELNAGGLDLSNYVAIGASLSSGYTDGALFIAAQENSFPNTLSKQFAKIGGGAFTQPLMKDNTGGMIIPIPGVDDLPYRLIFNGTGPQRLNDFYADLGAPAPVVNTIAGENLGGVFNNVGVPGSKSTHIDFNGYAALNPYFGRMATSADVSMLEYAIAQNPTFFTLSEIGGNDVLGYATSGGDGSDPITPVATFELVFNDMVNQLTAVCPNGAVSNVPNIMDLPHFTAVPHNPLDPTNPAFGPLIPTLNGIFSQLNQVYAFLEVPERSIDFSETEASAVVIKDETLADLSAQIAGVLNASPTFPAFVESFGLPAAAAPLVANLFGQSYGQTREANENDLLTLPSSSIIGTVNTDSVVYLMGQGLSQELAGQFSVEGISFPLADKWVLLPSEQQEITDAVEAYNLVIEAVAVTEGLALIDLNGILSQISTTGIVFDDFTLDTGLVTGGAFSLDGIHLTARGYALMANKVLEAIDATYGSNFVASGNVAKAGEFPTNYSPMLQ